MNTSSRPLTLTRQLARAGFVDTRRAGQLLHQLDDRMPAADPPLAPSLVAGLAAVADPDSALLGLLRLHEALCGDGPGGTGDGGADGTAVTTRPGAAAHRFEQTLREGGPGRERLLAVLGGSTALVDHLARHPGHWLDVASARRRDQAELCERLTAAVAGSRGRDAYDGLRVAYRRELVQIAALDLTASDPAECMPETAAALADLAAAALQAALLAARAETEDQECCSLAVIGMGKAGGRELNYISDVDVIFVAEPVGGAEEERALAVGTQLATALMRACSAATGEGSLWQVDPALRPEGKQGPLVRTVASHRHYYERWAKTWEFQALLKARPLAGDPQLAARYLEVVEPLVWQASGRDRFVEDVQAMRRRVEEHVPAAEARRQLKLGPGGLRDIEFSVQLLQLVHGRADPELRSGTTLEALGALREGGYVGRDDAAALDAAYRMLRVLEHRIQLHRLRRTHLVPTDEADLRRLGRAVGHRSEPGEQVLRQWQAQAREVRRLHERLFYRPLLRAVAQLSTDEVRMSPEAARDRLSALGFGDPAGAMRHLESLTAGVSRRATIQRHLLPVMLGWFAEGADADAGLLAFRRISDSLGSTHWYLKMLRDEGSAAQRLAHVLSSSRYAVELLIRAPESVALLGDAAGLAPTSAEALRTRMRAAIARQSTAADAMKAARTVRATELLRIVIADLVGQLGPAEVAGALTDLTGAVLDAALQVAGEQVTERDGPLATRLLVVGMGRLGGGEMGYASDADVMYVHDPEPGAEPDRAQDQATQVVQELRRLMAAPGPDPQLPVDADLRPEGRAGPMVRSLAAYRAYYDRWSAGWESQALTRAAPVAGDQQLAEDFTALIDPLRWPDGGISAAAVREIRLLKARVEAERLPRGADPRTHFKLGRGGVSDVEWLVQLIQLQHAHAVPGLRCTGTLQALEAAVEAGLVERRDADTLAESWSLACRLRDAGLLWRGRPVDSMPSDVRDADGIGRIMGLPPGQGYSLTETYRRAARRARAVFERLFYDSPGTD